MTFNGEGIQQNYAEGIKWITKSAEQGYMKAQITLGAIYTDGKVVKQSLAEAKKWFKYAADQGSDKAKSYLLKIEEAEKATGKNK
jgi:TPR repeat protein